MKKLFIIGSLLIPVFHLVAQNTLTPEQLTEDFALARQSLEEAHPGLYRYNSKLHVDSLFTATASGLTKSMTQQEFYRLLLPVIANVKCGHIKLHPDNNWSDNYFYGRDNLFPLKLFIEEGRAFITDSYDNSQIPTGSEILIINNMPIRALIDSIIPTLFSDGNNNTFKYIELARYFSAFYANLFGTPDQFTIQYLNGDEAKKVTLKAVSLEKIKEYENRQTGNLEPYYIEYLDNSIAVMTISSFWMNSDASFKKFLKKTFREIKEKGTENLIIDLRNNEGGQDRRGAQLLSYLMDRNFNYYDRLEATTDKKYSFHENAQLPRFYGLLRMMITGTDSGTFLWKHHKNLKVQKPARNHYDNKVYVLVNGASFSVTAEFAAVTHFLKRATLIGEETGGGYYGNNSGTFVIVKLPNSGLNIGIPMLGYYLAVKDYPYPDHGVIPHHVIKPDILDILSGNDPVMDYTLNMINTQIAVE